MPRHSDPQAKWGTDDGNIGDFADDGGAVDPLTAAPRTAATLVGEPQRAQRGPKPFVWTATAESIL